MSPSADPQPPTDGAPLPTDHPIGGSDVVQPADQPTEPVQQTEAADQSEPVAAQPEVDPADEAATATVDAEASLGSPGPPADANDTEAAPPEVEPVSDGLDDATPDDVSASADPEPTDPPQSEAQAEGNSEDGVEPEAAVEIDVQTLGARIRARRHAQQLSLSELARLSGVSKGYLSQIERSASSRPSAATLYAVARALGTTIAELIQNDSTIPLPEPPVIPESLREFGEEAELPPTDIEMLAGIRYRGASPRTKEDWRFLYESIRRSVRGNRKR